VTGAESATAWDLLAGIEKWRCGTCGDRVVGGREALERHFWLHGNDAWAQQYEHPAAAPALMERA
jgi:hypothetical protein